MRNKKGFTLIELVMVLGLLGLVMTVFFNFLLSTMKFPEKAMDEFEIQSKIRLLTQRINYAIRDASATFALYRPNHDNLTPGWNYIIPSMDQTSVIEYTWNGTSHISSVIAPALDGVTYNLEFDKLNPSSSDNLLEYKIIATYNGQTREVQSEIEALNSLQVIDRGSISTPSNALAYRYDARPNEISDEQAAVTMVLDTSGSMAWGMGGESSYVNDNSSNTAYHSRIKKLRIEAIRLIEGLSSNPNIYASIIPFESTANNFQAMLPVRVNDTASNVMLEKINSLKALGGTNTGDGLRRAYFITKEFNALTTKKTNNFMIVLVDGVTTFYSATRVNSSQSGITSVDYFLGDKNIENKEITSSNYNKTYVNGRYAGYGDTLDPWGTSYINTIGAMIRAYGSGSTADKSPIKVYVIGFSANSADYGSLMDIALATTGNSVYYQAGDSATLASIFTSIQKDINDSLWHIGGPN